MDSQTQALFDIPTIDKSGISEFNYDATSKKLDKSDGKSNKKSDNLIPLQIPKVPSMSALRKQRFVIHPLNEPGPSTPSWKLGGETVSLKRPEEISPNSPLVLTPGYHFRPLHHASMKSVVSSNQLTYMQTEPHQRTVGPITPQMLQLARSGSYIFNDNGSRMLSDARSVRSLASFGVGVTDGKRMIIRKVPNTPAEFLQIIHPPTPPDEVYEDESFLDIDDDNDDDILKPRKQHWASKMHFVLACIGYSVGLGNVWRFPYLCFKSGGGVFLVPYFIILFICGIPMLFMELAVGQYTGRGPIGAFGQICPLFKGVGLASVIVCCLISTYYSVIIAYSIYYLFTSFKTELPWRECSTRWGTPDCWTPALLKQNITRPLLSRTPSEEFFENKVLQMSDGIEFPGGMRWELVACLICAWVLVYFAIWKSIKSSAKIRYFTATMPFVLIIVFMGRALTLEGADIGLRFFFRPDWSQLKNANVWINAAAQNLNSFGTAFGSMISFASYNRYNNNILHDTLAVSFVNAVTSLLVGIFAFATIGNIALEQGKSVVDAVTDGPGLIFVVYPQALGKMPAPGLWSVMFFFMLLCLGLNSQFAIVEVVVTSIQDGFPNWIRRKLVYHELLVLIICVGSFFLGLPNIIQGGIYFFQLVDHYVASITVIFLAFFQIIAISWFYGVDRLAKNIKQMTGKKPSQYFRFCWMIASPSFFIALWVLGLFDYKIPTYHNGKYEYPDWAHHLGWIIAGISLVCLPTFAIFNISKSEGSSILEKFKKTLQPNIYECKICGEHHCEHDFPEEAIQEMLQATPIVLQTTPPIPHQSNNHHVTISDKPITWREESSSSDSKSPNSDKPDIEIVARPTTSVKNIIDNNKDEKNSQNNEKR